MTQKRFHRTTILPLKSLAACAYIPPVSHAATAPIEALPPERQRTVPGRIGVLLGIVHTLIAYGRNLAATLQLHVPAPHLLPCFTYVATAFDISSLPLILNRITRGLLRAAALQERLRRRAASGRDFELRPRIRPPSSARTSHGGGKRTRRLHDPARNRFFAYPPMLSEIAAEDQRRPIAAILYDICLDLGIEPDQLDQKAWIQLCRDIIDYRGNLVTFMTTRWRQLDPPIP